MAWEFRPCTGTGLATEFLPCTGTGPATEFLPCTGTGPATANYWSPNADIVRGTATATALDTADLRPVLPVAAADVVIR